MCNDLLYNNPGQAWLDVYTVQDALRKACFCKCLCQDKLRMRGMFRRLVDIDGEETARVSVAV